MGTTADKLNHIINTKEGTRQELNRAYKTEEINTSDTFNSYIQKLEEHPLYVDMFIERSIKDIKITNAINIGYAAFGYCTSLTNASFPNVTSIGDYAFRYCSNLTSVSIPNTTSIGRSAFYECSSLISVSFPNATSIGSTAFKDCSKLTTIYVGTNTSTVCTLSSTNAFNNCTNLTNIYVPASLLSNYKSATNWSSYSSKIKAAP